MNIKKLWLYGTIGLIYAGASEHMLPPSEGVTDDDHAFETVIHYDQERGGYVLTNSGWRIGGDIRTGYVRYDYDNPPLFVDATGTIVADEHINKGHADSRGFYVVPKLFVHSPKYGAFDIKVTVAGATDFGLNDSLYEQRTFVFDPKERKSFALLQEAYVRYDDGVHTFVAGAKETVTPMIDADDWYMLANSFQGAYYVDRTFNEVVFAVGYFYKMAGVWDSGANGTQWHSMSQASFVDADYKAIGGDKGVWTAAMRYKKGAHHFQLWEYYMPEYYNTFFAQYDYTAAYKGWHYDAGVQYIDFKEVGGLKRFYQARNKEIDYGIVSFRFDGRFDNGCDFALGASFFSDGGGTGDTLGAWGGYPYFANGMIFHFFEAGSLRHAKSYKLQVGYDFAAEGIKGLWSGVRLTRYDLDERYAFSSTGEPQNAMTLLGFKTSYSDDAGHYATVTYEHVDLDEEPNAWALRIIGGWRF